MYYSGKYVPLEYISTVAVGMIFFSCGNLVNPTGFLWEWDGN